MTAHNDNFPWPSHYGHFRFFENRMRGHGRVAKPTAIGGGVYELTLVCGTSLRIFICECYSYGAAEYVETIETLGQFDAIIINSAWCSYTPEAKRLCRDQEIGLFKIGDFMAAINRPEFWLYLNERESEAFEKKGWL